jgi:hypothetical protein
MLTKLLSPQRLWRYAAVYFFYLALAILITYPLVTVLSTQMAGDNSGDAYETARHIWWYRHALQTGQPLFYQSLLAYPDGIPSMYLWAIPLRTFPAWLFAFFMPVPAAFNVMLLLRLALNGAAMCWTAHQFTRNRGAALIAGTIYLAFPAMQGHLLGAHVDLLALWAVPLYVWSLFNLLNHQSKFKFIFGIFHGRGERNPPSPLPHNLATSQVSAGDKRSGGGLGGEVNQNTTSHIVLWRSIMFTAFLFVLSLLGSFVLLIYMLFPITAVFMFWRLIQRDWRGILYSIAAVVIGGAISLIFVLPAVLELLSMPSLHEGGSVRYSADLLAAISPSFFNPLYQNLGYNRQVLGVNLIEGSGYLGIIVTILALIGIWRAKAARWWLALAFVAWIFSLGPLLNINGAPVIANIGDEYQTYIPLPWALFQSLPVLDISRTPGRFNFVVGLCMAMMAAYGVASVPSLPRLKLLTENRWAKLAIAVLIALILFDYQSFFPLPTVRADIPDAITALGQRDDVRAVFNIPWDNLLAAKEGLYLQTGHGLPLIAGQVTRETPVDPAKLTILQETLDPTLLREAGADVVIVHRAGFYDADGKLFTRAQQQLGEPIYTDDRFAVFDVPLVAEETQLQMLPMTDSFQDRGDMYIYTPQSGWFGFFSTGTVMLSETTPTLEFDLDHQPIGGTGNYLLNLIPLSEAGYHTITLRVEPRCPEVAHPLAFCTPAGIYYERAPFSLIPDTFTTPISFSGGITLRGAVVIDLRNHAAGVNVALWWQFETPPQSSDIRFIKILNEQGEQVGAVDSAVTMLPGGQVAETWMLNDSLPHGEYRAYVGWYSYPDLTRFPILSGGADERAQDGLAFIGSFTVESP